MTTENGEEPPKKTNKPKKSKDFPKRPPPGEPPPGKSEWICRPVVKRHGKVYVAAAYGHEAWCFWV